MENLPSLAGTYALHLNLPAAVTLKIGKMGVFSFPRGDYVYLGSAFGPGGLRARLGRHLRGRGKLHWHIDCLRAVASIVGFHFAQHRRDSTHAGLPLECRWSQAISTLGGSRFLVPGFGASDCRGGCSAHLVALAGTFDGSEQNAVRDVLLPHSYSYKLISCYLR